MMSAIPFVYNQGIKNDICEVACALLPDMLYLKTQREQPPKWLTNKLSIKPPLLAKVQGRFCYALKHYLINVKTNVSNARMNIPKAIKSLKSKGFLSISTTPILCRIEVIHPITRLFLVEV